MKGLGKLFAYCVYAWLGVVMTYGLINFWDAPYRRCGTEQVYCGKRGTRHTQADANHLKRWEKIFVAS